MSRSASACVHATLRWHYFRKLEMALVPEYTAPAFARRGVGKLILGLCEAGAAAERFGRVELVATLSGQPLSGLWVRTDRSLRGRTWRRARTPGADGKGPGDFAGMTPKGATRNFRAAQTGRARKATPLIDSSVL